MHSKKGPISVQQGRTNQCTAGEDQSVYSRGGPINAQQGRANQCTAREDQSVHSRGGPISAQQGRANQCAALDYMDNVQFVWVTHSGTHVHTLSIERQSGTY